MPVSTTDHAITAIYEALTTVTGFTRGLTSAQLFARGLPAGMPASPRARDARVQKRVFVGLGEMTARAGIADENGSEHQYDIIVLISRDYWLGYEGKATQVQEQMKACADDFPVIRKALCAPGALEQTAALNATGLAGCALRAPAARTQLRIEGIAANGERLLNAIDRFRATLLWDPDA